MKGQQEALSAVLISGILIGVVGSVYFWGIPLIQKNKDVSLLENSESFMQQLDSKIKAVANNGGRDQIIINVPGLLRFDGEIIEFSIETDGTIYATDAEIPLGRSSSLQQESGTYYGTWGVDDPVLFIVKSNKLSQNKYKTDYSLTYVELRNAKTLTDFKITLTGQGATGGLDKTVVIESEGDSTTQKSNGRTLINSNVKIIIL
ncbi:MAG TPA: hypothetical protein VJB05_04255 [archaeon]|nr:hypothetical protein [archaeon]